MSELQKTFRLCFISLFLLFSLSLTARAAQLNVTRYKQVKSNWCWAACAQMIGHYFGYSYDQYDINLSVKGNTTNNQSASLDEVTNAVNYATGHDFNYGLFSSLERFQLDDEINVDEIPLIMRMQWNSGGGHVLVLCGVTGNNLTLIDPWENCVTRSYSYVALLNGTSIQSGTGYYSHTWMSC